MRALVLDAATRTATVKDVPIPKPGPGEVLVRVKAVALNPVDALYTANPLGGSGRIVGSDFSGVVESASGTLATGQRVAGFLQGACSSNDRPGAFAEYLVTPEDLVWRLPDSISDEEAATMNLCALTAAQGVFYRLGLPAPFPCKIPPAMKGRPAEGDASREHWFFVYGATTSVGMYVAQLVRRGAEASGKKIKLVGAASKGHFAKLRAEPFGYDALVDYRSEDWVGEVRSISGGGGVDFAYDGISEGMTVQMVSRTLRKGGGIAIVRSKEAGAWKAEGLDPDVFPIYGAVWEALGQEIKYQKLVISPSPDARAFAVEWYKWLSGGGKLEANPARLMPGGFDRIVPDGFVLLGTGTMDLRENSRDEPWMKPVSGEKLVYRVDA